jgi:hypothetical protein
MQRIILDMEHTKHLLRMLHLLGFKHQLIHAPRQLQPALL